MKISFLRALAIALIIAAIPLTATAQTKPQSSGSSYENPYGYHPCATEKETVSKTCKKGDPCGKACQTATKKLKKCRLANNLPAHEAGGNLQKADCTKPEDLPGAAVDSTPSVGAPVNPLQSNHF